MKKLLTFALAATTAVGAMAQDFPNKPIMLIGRQEECDIQLNSRKISRKHCCIAQVNNYLVVRDLGSTNGVRINGVRAQEGTLRAGDELTIGNHRYQVSLDVPLTTPQPALRDARTEPRPPSAEAEMSALLPDGVGSLLMCHCIHDT